jgi:pyridoxal phosphate enzyme (YggS family)
LESIDIEGNLKAVAKQIAVTAESCGRDSSEVQLIAVTKTFSAETILEATAAGQLRLGENRIQEAEPKIHALSGIPGIEWHLVGHLQSNKVRRAAELFDVVHSLDGVKLAVRLSEACSAAGRVLRVLLQVDLGHEATKHGADPNQVRDIIATASGLEGIRLDGLMTIPPFFDEPEQTRPYFSALRQLRDTLESEQAGCLGQGHLSMGMSHDFEVAIQEGATMVRVGTAIFGVRSHV